MKAATALTTSISHQANRAIDGFAPHISGNSIESARVIVPLLLRYARVTSIADFGCKHGEWLYLFREYGIRRVLGFDQPRRQKGLLIDASEFRAADLAQPITVESTYDLAVCIEVAEHLPPSAAEPLVATLAATAPLVLFSAAVPHQGGHGHRNEQPRAYWRDRFEARGFQCLDCIRPHIWQDPRVAWWYRQNLFLYASADALRLHPALKVESERPIAWDVDLLQTDVARRQSLRQRALDTLRTWSSRFR